MTSAINHLAAILFITVMLLGMGSLLVHRVRLNRLPASLVNRPNTYVAAPAETPTWTVWERTVADLGHPNQIDLNPPPCPPWPTWHSIPDSRYQTAITALTNEH